MYWCDWPDELELIRSSLVCVLRASVSDPLWMCVCFFRLLSGHTCYVLWVCLSTSHWMPSTGSRLDAPIAVLRWVSCLTTAVTPSPPVSFFFFPLFGVVPLCPSESEALNMCSCVCLCSVCGVGNQYSSADGYQPRLDVLLLLRRDVYVLLCPLANLRVGNAALRHVSQQKLLVFLFSFVVWRLFF